MASSPNVSEEILALREGVRTRFDTIAALPELRVAKAWDLAWLARQLVALSYAAGEEEDAAAVLGLASQAAGAAAMATSPRASDLVLGTAQATRGDTTLRIAHERRPIDPMDYFGAFCVAALLKDAAVLRALGRAIDDVAPDLVLSSRTAPERAIFREAFACLDAAALGDRDATSRRALAAAEAIEAGSSRLDEFRVARIQNVLAPVVEGVAADDAAAALARALEAHARHATDARTRDDPAWLVAWGPLALASLRRLPRREVPAAANVPEPLAALLDREAPSTALAYDVPPLCARTEAEVLLRVELSSPGEIVVEREVAEGDRPRLRVESRDRVVYRYEVTIDDAAPWPLLDAGELVHVAEASRERMRASPEGSPERAEARTLALRCAEGALAALAGEEELYRDRMTSPLGRAVCDAEPPTLTRAHLEALVASVRGG